MNTTTSFEGLRFFTTPWTIGISVALVIAVVVVSLVTWRRGSFSLGTGLVELLRVVIAALVAALLNQPEWVEEFRPTEKPVVAVLVDASRSMDTQDVVASGDKPGTAKTRREAVAELEGESFWRTLEERYRVKIEPFSVAPDAIGTDLASPLVQALERESNLRAVVLAADGDWNEGVPPLEAAQRMRLAQVPVFAVPVGSQTKLPDVELVSLDCPTVGVVGKPVRVPFTIHSSLPTERIALSTSLRPNSCVQMRSIGKRFEANCSSASSHER